MNPYNAEDYEPDYSRYDDGEYDVDWVPPIEHDEYMSERDLVVPKTVQHIKNVNDCRILLDPHGDLEHHIAYMTSCMKWADFLYEKAKG